MISAAIKWRLAGGTFFIGLKPTVHWASAGSQKMHSVVSASFRALCPCGSRKIHAPSLASARFSR